MPEPCPAIVQCKTVQYRIIRCNTMSCSVYSVTQYITVCCNGVQCHTIFASVIQCSTGQHNVIDCVHVGSMLRCSRRRTRAGAQLKEQQVRMCACAGPTEDGATNCRRLHIGNMGCDILFAAFGMTCNNVQDQDCAFQQKGRHGGGQGQRAGEEGRGRGEAEGWGGGEGWGTGL